MPHGLSPWIGTLPVLLAAQHAPSAPPRNGYWEAPFQHEPAPFNAVHMALVPVGPHRGRVLVWDYQVQQGPDPWDQRWAIVDARSPLARSPAASC